MEYDISIIQFEPALGNPEANIATLETLFDKTISSSLVILPELSNAGYNFHDSSEASRYAEVIGHAGLFQDFIIRQAALRNIHIVTGICERDGDNLFNTAILAGPSGIAGKYRKIHLFMNEKDIFKAGVGDDLEVYDVGGFRVGMMICFDYLFPEPWRILASKGADLVCHPSNLLTLNAQRCIPGLSLMNRIFVATANRIGTERGVQFNGSSFFAAPTGEVTALASANEPAVISFKINTDQSRNKMVTSRNHVFDDRRPELYGK